MKKVVCPPCGTEIRAETDDELVRKVQEHAKTQHGHDLSREHVLAAAKDA